MARITSTRLNRCALAAAISLAIASGGIAGERNAPDGLPASEIRASASPAGHPGVGARSELVFVDRRLPDHLQLVRAISADAEIHFIDGDRNGIEQIAVALSGRSGIRAIHLLSHGDDGVLLFGSEPLHIGNLRRHEDALRTVGAALAPGGDILLYGCNVAASPVGEEFVAALAAATGADVAASRNTTSGNARGGDWDLEIAVGDVAAAAVLDIGSLTAYQHDLATFSVSTISGLRTALSTAATNNVPDTITLTANIAASSPLSMPVSATDGQPTFVDIHITDGHTVEIVGGAFTIDANKFARVMEVRTGNVSISNLILREGVVAGDGGNWATSGTFALGGAIRNAGTLMLSYVTVTASAAAGGGGGGGSSSTMSGGGGGGSGLSAVGGDGGAGRSAGGTSYAGESGTFGASGNGGGSHSSSTLGGRGGSTSGGAGGEYVGYSSASTSIGGTGGTASSGALSIGGGGGGGASRGIGGGGGGAAGAIYNTGSLTMLGSTVSNNVGAGGGGGGGSYPAGVPNEPGGTGGIGVGGLWNALGAIARLDSTSHGNLLGNVGSGGNGGQGVPDGPVGVSHADLYNLGTLDTNYVPPTAPTATNLTQTVTYTEDPGGSVPLADIVVTDPNPGDTITVTLTLSDPAAGVLTTGTFGAETSSYNAGSGIWTVDGSVVDINAALAAVAFTPAANWDQDVTIATRIVDAATTGPTDGVITLDVTPVNDAPAGTNNTVTTLEDSAYTFSSADFGFSDSDGDTLLSVMMTTLPGAGTLTNNGVPVSAGGFVTMADIDLNRVVFTPVADASGAGYASFTFQVRDDGGTADGGIDLDQTPNTITVDVTSVNNAPTGANNSVTTLEESAYTFSSADFGFSDSDGDTLLSVLITTLAGAGTLTNNGVAVIAGGSVTKADIDLNRLVFTPVADANGAGYASFTFQVRDDGGTADGGIDLDQTPNTLTVDVTAVNDAPVGTDATVTTLEDSAYTFVAADFGFSDSDGDALLSVMITTLPGAGSLTNNGVPVSAGGFVTKADIDLNRVVFTPVANANGSGYASFTFQVRDDGGTADGGIDLDQTPNTITVDVTSVNNAPVGSDATVTTLEDSAYTFAAADFGFSDSDGDTLLSVLITTLPGAGTLTNNGAAIMAGSSITKADIDLNRLVFTPVADANGAGYASFTFQVRDDGGTADGGIDLDQTANTLTVDVTAVNDAPVVSVPASIGVTEGTASAVTGISFSDVDAGGGSVTATLSVASGTLAATSGGGVTVGGSSSALTLIGTVANINAFIAGSNLTYTTAANATSDVPLTVAIDDGGNTGNGGAQADSNTTALQVSAVNDAPVVTVPPSIAVTEDVATALTGISFADVDAGSATVIATFSVASGTLTASSGSGVAVAGEGTGSVTLSGGLADINAFVAASALTFQTALDSTSNVVLTVAVADNGNTGTGGNLTDSDTVTLLVNAVNDAPVNALPTAQVVDQDASLVFSSGNGNLVSISDVDAGGGILRVTLTGSNGLITLSATTGLNFVVGSGANDGTMTFEGTITDINSALNGLIFSPMPGYNGAASVQVTTSDLGLNGSGGTQADTDTIAITVNSTNPVIASVQVSNADGGYRIGDVITATISFDQLVTVAGGTPTLLLETGTVDRQAAYAAGSGSATLAFSYTVQAGDLSADLDYASTAALSLNGATIRNAASDDAITTLPGTGGPASIAGQHAIVIDGIVPVVGSVAVPADGSYVDGQALDFSVSYSEAVFVTGTPSLTVTLDSGASAANYLSGSGSNVLVFRSTVADGQFDADGITLGASIGLNGGALRDSVGNDAVLALNSVGDTSGVRVDAAASAVLAVAVPTDGFHPAGSMLDFTLTLSEPVTVDTGGGTPRVLLDVGGASRFADYLSGSGSGALLFRYTVQSGDNDADGITLGATLDANGGSLADAAGNPLQLALNGIAATAGIVVDTTPPTASIVIDDSTLTVGETALVTITFSEPATGFDNADLTVPNGSLSAVSSSDGDITFTATLTPDADTDAAGNVITLAAGGVADRAGNAGVGSTASNPYDVATHAATTTLSLDTSTLIIGGSAQLILVFSEAVSGLTASDLAAPNATLSEPASSDGGLTWTATLSPIADVEASGNVVTLDNSGVVNGAGNPGVGSSVSSAYDVDTMRPTASIVVDDAALTVGETALVTITFSEPATGFDNADLTVPNGSLSAVSSSDGDITFTATLTPDADADAAGNVITLAAGGVADRAGNAGVGSTASNPYDVATNAATTTLSLDTGTLIIGGSAQLTLVFSEAVSGLTASDLSAPNATLSEPTSSDGGLTWTATLTPVADVEASGNVVTLDNSGVVNGAGNPGVGSSVSSAYDVDTMRPTASIVVDDATLTVGETVPVTITFSEPATGFDNADLTVPNGSLSAVSSSDGDITFTATLTPDADTDAAGNVITLAAGGVADRAGNAGVGSTASNPYDVATHAATTTLSLDTSTLIIGGSAQLTLVFSEAVSGLTASDLSAPNATLSEPASSDGGLTWTATLSPIADVEASGNVVTLDNSGVVNGAGNPGVGSSASSAYDVDTVRPTAVLLVADEQLTRGETSAVTITFSEPVSGFDNADLAVANGSVSPVSSADGGRSWSTVFTPTANATSNGNTITLDAAGVADLAGNSGSGSTASNAFSIDTLEFAVGGSLSGLVSGGSLGLQLNAAHDLALTSNGSFVFTSTLGTGDPWSVAISTQPNEQTCTLDTSSGVIADADIALTITCSDDTSAPAAPLNVSGTPGDGRIAAAWQAPADDGDSPITGYVATVIVDGSADPAGTCNAVSASGCTITGLVNGVAYRLSVVASNASGAGPAATSAELITPFTAPGAPTNVTVEQSGNEATVSWTPPDSDGGLPITGYTVVAMPGGASCSVSGSPPPTSCVITGLIAGQPYTFSVTAQTAGGGSGAPGTVVGPSPPQLIPTTSPATLFGLVLLLGLSAGFSEWRRRKAEKRICACRGEHGEQQGMTDS